MEEAIFYGESEGIIYLRASGHVTARVCPGLKSRLFGRLVSEPPVSAIFLDLGSCEYMDSTFLGLVVGTQKRFGGMHPRGSANRRVVLIAPDDTCVGLLRTIGVLGMIDVAAEGPSFPELERIPDGTRTSAKFILDAHEELSGLSAENRTRFAALSSVIKGALEAEKNGGERN